MKKFILPACTAIVFLLACNNSGEKSDTPKSDSGTTEPKKEEAWVPADSATMAKAMEAYGTPGKMHEMMTSWNGTWTGETTYWEYAGATPQQSTGTAVNSMVFGKYQVSTHKGTMMGAPFEGHSTLGYDNATKQFVSSWIDIWSTGIMNLSGPWDEATKTMTLTGTSPDICRPGKMCATKEVFTIIDDNTQKMEMYVPDPKTGKEFKMMEIKLTRKK